MPAAASEPSASAIIASDVPAASIPPNHADIPPIIDEIATAPAAESTEAPIAISAAAPKKYRVSFVDAMLAPETVPNESESNTNKMPPEPVITMIAGH